VAMKTVMNLDDIECCAIAWRSWAWQKLNLGAGINSQVVSIRPFVEMEPCSIMQLACRKAFWSLSKTVIKGLAEAKGISIESSATLFETLFAVIQDQLGTDDEATLVHVGQRLTAGEISSQFSEALLDIDEAAEVLETYDVRKVTQAQQDAREHESARLQFKREYGQRRTVVRDLLAKAAVKKGKAAAKAKGKKGDPPPLPSTMCQKTAKQFVPPGSFIWRGLSRSEWCGHMSPFRRVQASWHTFGEEGAMRRVVAMLWEQYCSFHGLPWPDSCPHKELLGIAGASSGGAASSSSA